MSETAAGGDRQGSGNGTSRPERARARAGAHVARAEILAASARTMRRSGYADMSLRDLAAQVGMKAGSLYYHFASKDELVTEVMRIGVESVEDAVRKALEDQGPADPKERLHIAVRVHLETLLTRSDFVSSHIRCYPFVPQAVRDELREPRRRYDALWSELCRDYLGSAATPEDVRYLRLLLVGALNNTPEWFSPDRDDVVGLAKRVNALLAGGRREARFD